MKSQAYKHTTVNFMKTQTKITELLRRHDIYDTRWTNTSDKIIFEFNKKIKIENKEELAGVRIIVTGVDDKNRNQLSRALFYYLKSKMEFLEFGFIEFLQEFMPHLILGQGTAYQLFKPQYEKALIGSKIMTDVKMIPEIKKSEHG